MVADAFGLQAPPIDEELPATEEEANQKVEAQAPSDDVDNQAQAAQEDELKPGDAPMQQPEVPSDPPVEEARHLPARASAVIRTGKTDRLNTHYKRNQ